MENENDGNNGTQPAMTHQSYPPPAPPVATNVGAQPVQVTKVTVPLTADPQSAGAMLNTWGHNTRLSPKDIKRATLEHVQKLADNAGQQVPTDIVDFLDRANVIFLDENNKPVRFERVVVTWENS